MSYTREGLIEDARTRCTRFFDALARHSDRPERDLLLKLINNAVLDILNWFSVDRRDFEETLRLRSLTLGHGDRTRAVLSRHGTMRDKLKWGRSAYQWLFGDEEMPETDLLLVVNHPDVQEGDLYSLLDSTKRPVLDGELEVGREIVVKTYPGSYVLLIYSPRTGLPLARFRIKVPLTYFTYEMACEILGCDPGIPRKLVADEIHRLLSSHESNAPLQFEYQLAVVYR